MPSPSRVAGTSSVKLTAAPAKVMRFTDASHGALSRITASGFPFEHLFPQGMVAGSVLLLTGEPGSGKSTLALQLAQSISATHPMLYVSAEESIPQVKERATRIGQFSSSFGIAESTNLEEILSTIRNARSKVVCIDSLQTIITSAVSGEPGSLVQLKAVTAKLVEFARAEGITLLVIGHVTKDGTLAGPKSLEHLVDAVYYLESDRHSAYRLLRVYKNRYGASGTVLVMHLGSGGMQRVPHPATIFIRQHQPKVGSIVTLTEIDDQLFFVEVQALATKSSFGYAKRTASGFSKSRLELLLAIIKKKLHVDTDQYDVYLNIAGGFSVHEPALDLAVVTSVLSSIKEEVAPEKSVFFGEVGLSGELRIVKDTSERLKTITEHGFTSVFFPPLEHAVRSKLTLQSIDSIGELVKRLGW